MSKQDLLAYYTAYAAHFDIRPIFRSRVTELVPTGEQCRATTADGRQYRARQVVVCSGFNAVPHRPKWSGEAVFGGTVTHSRRYRNPQPYRDKRVLVIGMGNTGAELALDLSEAGIETYLSVRGPVNIVPRDFRGRPVQQTAKLIRRLPDRLGDWIGRQVQRRAIGDLRAFGIKTPAISPARQLREQAKTPVIDLGTVAAIRAGRIRVVPGVGCFTATGVRLTNGADLAVDHVILATGYRTGLAGWLTAPTGVLDARGIPTTAIAGFGLYFVGFDAYASGLLDSIHRDSERVVRAILRAR